jgi:hypothetical protein
MINNNKKKPYFLNDVKDFKTIQKFKNDFYNNKIKIKISEEFNNYFLKQKIQNLNQRRIFFNVIYNLYMYLPSFITFAKFNELKKNKIFTSHFFFKEMLNNKKSTKNYKFIFNRNKYKKINKLKILLYNYYINIFLKKKDTIAIDLNDYSKAWIKKNKKTVYYPSNNLNFFLKKKINNDILKNYSKFTKKNLIKDPDTNLVYLILEKGSKFLIKKFLSEGKLQKRVLKICQEFITYNLTTTEYISSKIDNDKLNKNIISSIGGFLPSRLLCGKAMQLNRKIIRFDHGNGFLNGNHKDWILNEGMCTTEFFCISKQQKNLAIKFFKRKKYPLLNNNIKFTFFNFNKKIENLKTSNSQRKKRVIYLTKNFEHERTPGPLALNDVDYLNIQSIIYKKIKNFDRNLIFQPHPDNIIKMKNLFYNNHKQKKLKDVIKDSYVAIFDCYTSSAFYEILNLGIPIILFKFYTIDNLSPLNNSIKDRCVILEFNDLEKFEGLVNKLNINKLIKIAQKKSDKFKKFNLN